MTSKEKTPKAESRHSSPVTSHSFGLPHRPPFVFVRKLIACDTGLSAECETWFDSDDPMFAGHFPGDPLVPGVILTEALAQTAGIAAASVETGNSRPRFLLSAIRQMKFFAAVRPNERIRLSAKKVGAGVAFGEAASLVQFDVEAFVEGKRVAAGQLVLNTVN